MGLQFTVEDQPDLTIPEDLPLRARLLEIKPRTINWNDKQTGAPKSRELLEWWWEVIADGDYQGRKVKGECDAKISSHPRNRFRQWAEALLDRELPSGMVVDVDDLVGMVAEISIRHDKDSKDATRIWERVDEVIPLSGSGGWADQPPF